MGPRPIATSLAPASPRRPVRVRLRLVSLVALVAAISACALDHQASARFVDPKLRSAAEPIVAGRPERDVVRIGDWTVRDVTVTRLRDAGRFGLDAGGESRRPAHLYSLSLNVVRSGRIAWRAECEARRGQAQDADYAAVLDESHDAVALHCEITPEEATGEEPWILDTRGTLRTNVQGKASSPGTRGSYTVEILTRYKLFTLIQRETPIAVGQVRTGAGTKAAMTLARPEHVWIASGSEADAGLWIALLAVHRFAPLGFND